MPLLKRSVVFISLILFSLNTFAYTSVKNEVDKLIESAVQKVDEMDEESAIGLFSNVLEIDPENYTALWNKSLLTTRKYYRMDADDETKMEGYREAIEIAEKTLGLYPDKGHSHYVYAVAKGRYADLEGTRDMIEASHVIYEHIKKAADLIPDYAPLWHLYGVWHSDISTASRAEEMAASFISEGLPDEADEDKAEKYLNKSIEMMPESILFRVDLAKHYMEIGEDEKAIEVLEEAISLEPKMMDDDDKKEEAKELLDDLK